MIKLIQEVKQKKSDLTVFWLDVVVNTSKSIPHDHTSNKDSTTTIFTSYLRHDFLAIWEILNSDSYQLISQ